MLRRKPKPLCNPLCELGAALVHRPENPSPQQRVEVQFYDFDTNQEICTIWMPILVSINLVHDLGNCDRCFFNPFGMFHGVRVDRNPYPGYKEDYAAAKKELILLVGPLDTTELYQRHLP